MRAIIAISLFACIVIGACAAMALIGICVARLLKKYSPNHFALAPVTPTGIALIACLTLMLVLFTAARTLAPDSSLGDLLSTGYGLITAAGCLLIGFVAAAVALQLLGSPLFKAPKRDD